MDTMSSSLRYQRMESQYVLYIIYDNIICNKLQYNYITDYLPFHLSRC